jgi:hypothetical protein
MSAPVIDDKTDATEATTETDPAIGPEAVKPEGAPDLGDAGKQAIDRMKAERNTERDKRRQLEAEIAELKKPKPVDGEQPDIQALLSIERDKIRAEQMTDKALDKIEARAAKLFANPEDARMFLEGKVKDFVDGGKVDVAQIDEALADLLKERPYLAVAQGGKRFEGSGDGGPKGEAGKPQLTKADLERMSKAGDTDGINAARIAGQFDVLLGIKKS